MPRLFSLAGSKRSSQEVSVRPRAATRKRYLYFLVFMMTEELEVYLSTEIVEPCLWERPHVGLHIFPLAGDGEQVAAAEIHAESLDPLALEEVLRQIVGQLHLVEAHGIGLIGPEIRGYEVKLTALSGQTRIGGCCSRLRCPASEYHIAVLAAAVAPHVAVVLHAHATEVAGPGCR